MLDEHEGRQMPEWQAASIAFLMAVVMAAIALAIIDPDGMNVAADASMRFWSALHDQQFESLTGK
jgi:hypothetical protein